MSDILGWFEANEKRSLFKKMIQKLKCNEEHDYEYNYLLYKSGKKSEYYDKGVCKRCNYFQLYGIPRFVWDILNNE